MPWGSAVARSCGSAPSHLQPSFPYPAWGVAPVSGEQRYFLRSRLPRMATGVLSNVVELPATSRNHAQRNSVQSLLRRLLFRAAAAFLTRDFRATAGCAGEPRQGHCTTGSSELGTLRRAVSTTFAVEALSRFGARYTSFRGFNEFTQTFNGTIPLVRRKRKIIEPCYIITFVWTSRELFQPTTRTH